jgi:hypothetical protein
MEWRSLSTAAIRKLARQSRTYQRYRSMAVFHVSILGQTYETLQALVLLAGILVSKATVCATN